MSQPLRIECPDFWSFGTSRTVNSLLWFINNSKVEQHALRFLARYQEKYGVELFSFVLMGNHSHIEARFPGMNRSQFYRDLNARMAEGVRYFVPEFPGGPLFARRYSEQAIVEAPDLEEYFFYCALQPIQAGFAERLEDYPGYNSFQDAISGKPRIVKDVDWTAFNAARRHNPRVKKKDYTTYRKLNYSRLPGYEHLSQHDYKVLMLKKFEERRMKIIQERRAQGKGFLGRDALLNIVPGSSPIQTKKSSRRSKRPLILTRCLETKKEFLRFFFDTLNSYRSASRLFRQGVLNVTFPPGTYRPPTFVPS